MVYNEKVQEALAQGLTLDDIKQHAIGRYNEAMSYVGKVEDLTEKDIRDKIYETYGLRSSIDSDDIPTAQFLSSLVFANIDAKNDKSAQKPKADGTTEAKSFGDSIMAGWQQSVMGLALSNQLPNTTLGPDASLWQQLGFGLGSLVGDIPTMVLGGSFGGAAGGAAGAAAGPLGAAAGGLIGAGAGAGFVTDYVRQAYIEALKNGECTSWSDFWNRTARAFEAGGKGAFINSLTLGTGKAAKPAATKVAERIFKSNFGQKAAAGTQLLAAEAAAMATGGAVLEGRMPSGDDFVRAAVQVGGLGLMMSSAKGAAIKGGEWGLRKYKNYATNFYLDKFFEEWGETGRTPANLAQASVVDPTLNERIKAVNQKITVAEKSKEHKAFVLLGKKDLQARGIDPDDITTRATNESNIDVKAYGGQWLYGSEYRARMEVAKQFRDAQGKLPQGANIDERIQEIGINKFRNMLSLTGNTDSFQIKILKEFANTPEGRRQLEAMDPAFFQANPNYWQNFQTIGDTRLAPLARKMFESPSRELLQHLRTRWWTKREMEKYTNLSKKGLQNLPTKNGIVGSDLPGLSGIIRRDQTGTRYWLSHNATVKPSIRKPNLPSDISAALPDATKRMNEVLSIGEDKPRTWKEAIDGFMFRFINAYDKLDWGAAKGKHSQAYVDASVASGASGVGTHMFKYGMINGEGKKVGASLESILKEAADLGSLDELSQYMTARNFEFLNKRGINTGLKAEDSATIVKGLSHLEPVAKKLGNYFNQLLQYQVEKGVLSKAKYDKLRRDIGDNLIVERMVEAYEPFVKLMHDKGTDVLGGRKGDKLYLDPVENLVRMTYSVPRLVMQNELRKTVANTFGVSEKTAGRGSSWTRIEFMDKGKAYKYSVPREIARAVEDMDIGSAKAMGAMLRPLIKMTNLFRIGTTGTPTFALRNLTIDQFTAYIQSPKDATYRPFIDFMRGLGSTIYSNFTKNESMYTRWMKAGGDQSSIVTANRNYTQRVLKDIQRAPLRNVIKEPWKHKKEMAMLLNPLNLITGTIKGFEGISAYSDIATRVGQFMRSVEAGYSDKDAAFHARMSTVDFARAGVVVRSCNQVIAFLNARVQGAARMVETVKADPTTTALRVIKGIVMPTAMLAMARNDIIARNQNEGDPYYEMAQQLKQVPDWERNSYWHIPVPAINSVLRIPKPHEWAVSSALPVESLVDFIYANAEDREDILPQFATRFLGSAQDMLLPNVLPTGFLGPVEVLTNFSFFTGTNIIPTWQENMVPAMQYTPGTTNIARGISMRLQQMFPDMTSGPWTRPISPRGIEHLVRSWTGTMGYSLLQYIDDAMSTMGAFDTPVKPAKTLADMPFFHTFMVKYPSLAAQDIMKFNEEANGMTQRYNSVRNGLKSGDPWAIKMATILAHDSAFANMTKFRSALSNMSKAVQGIYVSNLDPESKRYQIEQIYVQMAQMAGQGRKIIRQIKKEMNDARRQ